MTNEKLFEIVKLLKTQVDYDHMMIEKLIDAQERTARTILEMSETLLLLSTVAKIKKRKKVMV